jgi:hypothetical protein
MLVTAQILRRPTTPYPTEKAGLSQQQQHTRLTHGHIIASVEELVDMEAKMMATSEIYEAAEASLGQSPGLLVNRLVAHFQKLFGVKSMQVCMDACMHGRVRVRVRVRVRMANKKT